MLPRLALLLMSLTAVTAWAGVDSLRLHIGDLRFGAWRAEDVSLEYSLSRTSADLRIAHLRSSQRVLEDVRIHCPRLDLSDGRWNCPNGRVRLPLPELNAEEWPLSFSYAPDGGSFRLHSTAFPLSGGKVAATLTGSGSRWSLALEAVAFDTADLPSMLKGHVSVSPDLSVSGTVDLKLTLTGAGAEPAGGTLRATLDGLNMEADNGRFAAQDMRGDIEARWWNGPSPRFEGDVRLERGQAYVDPVFVDVNANPLAFSASGELSQGRLNLSRWRLGQPGVVAASGDAAVELSRPETFNLTLKLDDLRLPAGYDTYIQPFLIGTPLDEMDTGGRTSGMLSWRNGALTAISLELHELTLDDRNDRFAVTGLGGRVVWPSGSGDPITEIHWRSAAAYGLPAGTSRLVLDTGANHASLLQPVRLPLLDGALRINSFELRAPQETDLQLRLDAELEPLSLGRLSTALGGPQLAGTLSGRLPSLSYRNGQVTLGGELQARVFDGRVQVSQLRLTDPLGPLPRLTASVTLRDLDLEQITSAFDFGRITGRLHGDIRDLRLIGWVPAAFDARFYTPPEDRSKHRISQRAIEELSSLGGGGAAAVLSRGFMRFFEDFSYDRMALGCVLREEVCLMEGLEPVKDGYYIVKGKGLPRVDVVGYARVVSWPTLVQQLRSIGTEEGPVIR